MSVGEVATRDFLRSELRVLLHDLDERAAREAPEAPEAREQGHGTEDGTPSTTP
jgi:hypothetical protein